MDSSCLTNQTTNQVVTAVDWLWQWLNSTWKTLLSEFRFYIKQWHGCSVVTLFREMLLYFVNPSGTAWLLLFLEEMSFLFQPEGVRYIHDYKWKTLELQMNDLTCNYRFWSINMTLPQVWFWFRKDAFNVHEACMQRENWSILKFWFVSQELSKYSR